MMPRNLVLLAAALLALGAGLWLANERSSGPALGSELLYPQLKSELDAITTVRVLRPGGGTAVTLQRQDDHWQVSERHDYRADTAKLHKLLLALADATVFEAKTANPGQYAVLGVQDISAADAGGVQLDLEGASQPYQLIIGKRGNGPDAYYVRRATEAQSWLVDAALEASADPAQWLQRNVLNISPDRVQSAEVRIGKARAYTATKQSRADKNFTVDGLPRGKQLKSDSAADSFATALSAITLTDVLPADEIAGEPAARSTFKTFDGLVVQAQGHRRDERYYLTLATSFDAEQAARFKLPTTAPAAGETDETAAGNDAADAAAADQDTATAADPVESESRQLTQRLAGWAFEVPAFKYEALFKPVEALTE